MQANENSESQRHGALAVAAAVESSFVTGDIIVGDNADLGA